MKALGRALFLAAVVPLLAACGSGIPPQGNYATVFGGVQDEATGTAIAGATVAVNGVSALTVATDDAGNFRISPVPTGDWDYIVSAPGYETVTANEPQPLGPGEQRSIVFKLKHSS
jgi:hypothetical protein